MTAPIIGTATLCPLPVARPMSAGYAIAAATPWRLADRPLVRLSPKPGVVVALGAQGGRLALGNPHLQFP
jgi:hypothetical protein